MNHPHASETVREPPAGQLEYWCRQSIRDLVRLYGFENARELVAIYINDEADRRDADRRTLDRVAADLLALTGRQGGEHH